MLPSHITSLNFTAFNRVTYNLSSKNSFHRIAEIVKIFYSNKHNLPTFSVQLDQQALLMLIIFHLYFYCACQSYYSQLFKLQNFFYSTTFNKISLLILLLYTAKDSVIHNTRSTNTSLERVSSSTDAVQTSAVKLKNLKKNYTKSKNHKKTRNGNIFIAK